MSITPNYRGIVATIDREESLVAQRGPVAWLMRRGLVWLSSADPWMLGWEHNPLLRRVVRRHGAMLLGIYAAAFVVQRAMQLLVPRLDGMLTGVAFTGLVFSVACALAAWLYVRRIRLLFDDQLRLAPLSPEEIVQAIALPPWAIGRVVLVPWLVMDLAVSVVIVEQGMDYRLLMLMIGGLLRGLLFPILGHIHEPIANASVLVLLAPRSPMQAVGEWFGEWLRGAFGTVFAIATTAVLCGIPAGLLIAVAMFDNSLSFTAVVLLGLPLALASALAAFVFLRSFFSGARQADASLSPIKAILANRDRWRLIATDDDRA